MKRFFLTLSVAMVVLFLASCQKNIMLSKVNATFSLDEDNTYMTGDPVTFHFSSDDYNIVFYSGELGHQYKFRERAAIYADDVDTMRLTLNIQHRSGNDAQALEIYYTDSFEGLDGNDGETDMLAIKKMYDGGMQGWTKFPYEEHGIDRGTYYTFEVELDHKYIENFCIAFYWNPTDAYPDDVSDPSSIDPNLTADTYWVNGSLELVLKEVATYTGYYDIRELVGTVVMMNEIDGTYYYQDKGDCSIQLNATTIAFQGGAYNVNGHSCEGWLFSYPTAFNSVDSDTGEVAKSYSLYNSDYSYTYYSPGTYNAAFVFTNANYLGGYRETRELTLIISGEEMERPDESEEEE